VKPQNIKQVLYRSGNHKVIQYKNGRLGFASMVTRMTKDKKRNALLLAELKELVEKPDVLKTMIVSDRIDHLKYLHQAIPILLPQKSCSLYIGGMKGEAREEAKACDILCASYGMAQEALDIKNMNAMILGSPYGNTEQVIGRLREGKTQNGDYHDRYVVDIVDCYSVFDGMAWKRYHLYRNLKYNVRRVEQTGEKGGALNPNPKPYYSSSSGSSKYARKPPDPRSGSGFF
jgi:hypothetical protein